jgi:hypothetical protein
MVDDTRLITAQLRRRSAAPLLAFGLVVASGLVSASGAQAGKPPPAPAPTLATFVTDPSPWLHLEPNSQQRSPIYLGTTPRELALGLAPVDGGVAKLPATLKALGELQLKGIRQSLIAKKAITAKQTLTVESWPMRDDRGRLTWAFARWRVSSTAPWRWLSTVDAQNTDPSMFVPDFMDPVDPADHAAIFDDLSEVPGLYDVPLFGDILWIQRAADPGLGTPLEGWLPTSMRESYGERSDFASKLALYRRSWLAERHAGHLQPGRLRPHDHVAEDDRVDHRAATAGPDARNGRDPRVAGWLRRGLRGGSARAGRRDARGLPDQRAHGDVRAQEQPADRQPVGRPGRLPGGAVRADGARDVAG